MVNVVITEDMRKRIISAANKEFEPLLERHKQATPDVGDAVYEQMFAQTFNGMRSLPAYCFRNLDSINFKVHTTRYEFKLTQKFPVPYTAFTDAGADWEAWSSTVIVKDSAQWTTVTDALRTWQADGEQLETKKNTFINSIRNILSTHRSINKALKFWPPLRQYIPADVMERMEAKVVKPEAAVATPVPAYGIDLDTLSATATLLRISK
tara:strand:- start:3276 stop:3902 length:627 start_codon:yes stop_codon:yes gene_type:complete